LNLILLIIGAVSAAVWAYLLLFRGGFWRVRDDSRPLGTPPSRRVCAVIPARNEAETIGRAVRSLKVQLWPEQLRVIVVDDQSEDATAALAREAGAEVIAGAARPLGWTGKMWAVSQGVERALPGDPDYLLLTDADIEHAPDSVMALASRAEAWGLDLASFMVRLRAVSFAERLMIPACVFFFLKLYPPRWIAQVGSRTAGAAGGCILIRPSALARIGGVARIGGELIDDCALAAAVKPGGRIWMGLTSTTHSIRAYRGFGEIRAMVSRTAFTQLRYSPPLLAGTLAGMVLTYLSGPALVLAGGWEALSGAAVWAAMSVSYVPMLRFYGVRVWWSALLPVVAIFYAAATVESAVRHWMGVGGEWKGRVQGSGTGR
jgi:hopene-associated glycosyltransferase HpnB